VAAAAEVGIEAGPRVPEPVGVREEHLAGEHARVGALGRRSGECVDEAGLDARVVVHEKHPLGATVERAANADVVPPGEAEVDAGADQLDVGEPLRDRLGGAVQ
jgi:hypothetical protein